MKSSKITLLISPNAFKESLSARDAAESIARGFRKVSGEFRCVLLPIADGGDGTMDVLVDGLRGKRYTFRVTGPLGKKVNARLGIVNRGKTGVIELAEGSGLKLIPVKERNPLVTTTFGTGELIREALDMNVKEIIIGAGGSATIDGGIGALMALGLKVRDAGGRTIPWGNIGLRKAKSISKEGLDPRLSQVRIMIACDVRNPLLGPEGAVACFGRQKGASSKMLPVLEKGLMNLCKLLENEYGTGIGNQIYTGSAGGFSAGFKVITGAELISGANLVLDYLQADDKIKQSDWVITGEGCLDRQTVGGKAPAGIAQRAKGFGKPVIALAGVLGEGYEELYSCGITACFSIQDGRHNVEYSIKHGAEGLEMTAMQVGRMMKERYWKRPR